MADKAKGKKGKVWSPKPNRSPSPNANMKSAMIHGGGNNPRKSGG